MKAKQPKKLRQRKVEFNTFRTYCTDWSIPVPLS